MPKDEVTEIKLRVPPDLRDWLREHASRGCRSVNAEVLFRLRAAMGQQAKRSAGKRREPTAMHAPSA